MYHVIVLPYFCSDEVRRYHRIATLLASYPRPDAEFRFLLAAAGTAKPDAELIAQLESLAEVDVLQCRMGGDHYWHGAATMFWEIMDHLRALDKRDGGFVLWMESDMVPIKHDWLDRLDHEWRELDRPLVMGSYVTHFPAYLGGEPVRPHINGGACYAKDLATVIPGPPGRALPFDMAMFPAVVASGRPWSATQQFAFASPVEASTPRNFADATILHGLGPEKDMFVDCVLASLRLASVPTAISQ